MSKIASLFESYFLQQSSCPVGERMAGKERNWGGCQKALLRPMFYAKKIQFFFHLLVSYLDNLGIEKCHLPTVNNKFCPFLFIEFQIRRSRRRGRTKNQQYKALNLDAVTSFHICVCDIEKVFSLSLSEILLACKKMLKYQFEVFFPLFLSVKKGSAVCRNMMWAS